MTLTWSNARAYLAQTEAQVHAVTHFKGGLRIDVTTRRRRRPRTIRVTAEGMTR
jgi:hypothetical protein